MKKLDLYIIKQFIGTYVFSIILILSIAVVFDLTEKMDDFFESGATVEDIITKYYFNFFPFYMNMFSSLFVFISVIFFTSKLAGNSEIIAMLSGGVSYHRIMLPYFISAFFIFSLSFYLGGYVIPGATKEMLDFENEYIKKFKTDNARNVQMEIEPGVIFYIESYQSKSNRGYRFSLETFNGKSLISRLTADRIRWVKDYTWTAENYLIRRFVGMREEIEKGSRLDTVIMVQPEEFYVTARESAQMSNPDLVKYLEKQSKRGVGNIQAFQNEYYKRWASPLAAFIMTLIGVSLSSQKVRGGMGLNLGVGIALSAIYILFSTISSSFAVNGSMSPFMATWLPNFIFLGIGIFLYIRAPK